MQKKPALGFSLIELMIVVTIIGILAAFALPSYHDYVKRARFSEVIAATAPFKTAISLALQQDVPLTDLQNGVHGIPEAPTPTTNLASITVADGIITATAATIAGGDTLILTPKKEGSEWRITGSCLKTGMCNQ